MRRTKIEFGSGFGIVRCFLFVCDKCGSRTDYRHEMKAYRGKKVCEDCFEDMIDDEFCFHARLSNLMGRPI